MQMEDRRGQNKGGPERFYSAEQVLGKLVEKAGLYSDYRKAMEAEGKQAPPMRYVDEKGRTVTADMTPEAIEQRKREYEAVKAGGMAVQEAGERISEKRERVSLKELEGTKRFQRPERRREAVLEQTFQKDRGRSL